MSPKLLALTAKEVIKLAAKAGFVFDRQKAAMQFITEPVMGQGL